MPLIKCRYRHDDVVQGVDGFFKPRFPPPWMHPMGALEATSWYDTGALKSTLEQFVDFDLLNSCGTRLFSIGAVNVRTGNFAYFDTTTDTICPEHVMASGALPPGFPAIEIEGEHYWDGGLVSNTPLDWVLRGEPQTDTLAFQVDLWNATGEFPRDMMEVTTRQKEIQYSSRTRESTERFKQEQKLRYAIADLLDVVPDKYENILDIELLRSAAVRKVYNIIHLIYHARNYEGTSKDCEFSRASMEEHWKMGYFDTVRTLRHKKVLERPVKESVFTFDLAREGRD